MKRTLIILCALLAGVLAKGQSFEMGVTAGSALTSCQIDAGVDFAAVFNVLPGLDLGAGTGVRFARPMRSKTIEKTLADESTSRKYSSELGIPVFGRIRYTFPGSYWVMVDAGYRFGIFNNEDNLPGGAEKKYNAKGVFIEPQVGFNFGSRFSLGAGMTLQHLSMNETTIQQSGDIIYQEMKDIHPWAPIAFLRFGIQF